jgi:hypothetical protein
METEMKLEVKRIKNSAVPTAIAERTMDKPLDKAHTAIMLDC